MRALVQEIPKRRMPQPPAEFLVPRVSRLNEALLVACGEMSGADLQAVDRDSPPRHGRGAWPSRRGRFWQVELGGYVAGLRITAIKGGAADGAVDVAASLPVLAPPPPVISLLWPIYLPDNRELSPCYCPVPSLSFFYQGTENK
ncbi:MAG TPA: hypothetical protein VJY34_02110 [Roseiarcus sp.]|nr:hypothetical protein [Roseiarcus sp.]